MPLYLKIEDSELPGMQEMLRRACNTWEPKDQPPWLQEFVDTVDARLAKLGRGAGPVPHPIDIAPLNMRALFDSGQDAYKAGILHADNPYLDCTPEYKSWSAGWVHARNSSSAVRG